MNAKDLVLVTGATGNTGAALLQQLESRRAVVRAMVRSSEDVARLPITSAAVVVGGVGFTFLPPNRFAEDYASAFAGA